MNYFVLLYDVVEDYVARRAVYRAEHLRLARAAHRRGELLLGGALTDPADQALLVFRAATRAVVEEFARNDPYVINGLVTRWQVRPWAVVIGDDAAPVRSLSDTASSFAPAGEAAASTDLVLEAADPRGPDAAALIRNLSAELARRYDFADDGSGNFKPEDALTPGSVFLLGRVADRAVACGALRPLEAGVAEIKRMFVEPSCRSHGYAGQLLAELERRAAALGYTQARLETGDRQPEAIRLYERAGYHRIANFGPYAASPRSVCFEKALSATPAE